MNISQEDKDKIITRSTEMLELAREVIKSTHEERYGEEPSIPEVVAVAQLIANLSAAGMFRDKLPSPKPVEMPVPTPTPTPEIIKPIVDNVVAESNKVLKEQFEVLLKERVDGLYNDLSVSMTEEVSRNIEHLIDGKISDAFVQRGFA